MAWPMNAVPALRTALAIALSALCGQSLAQAVGPTALALAIAKASQQVNAPPANPPALFLFQRLAPQLGGVPATLTVSLAASSWRVGSIDGPAATAQQLSQVLQQLQGVLLAGRCNASSARICAKPLDAPSHAGIASTLGPGPVLGWVATADTASIGPRGRYFGLLTPQYYTTPSSAALNASLVLRFGAAPRKLEDPAFTEGGVELVLHNDGRGSWAALPPWDESTIARVSADTRR
jgi:hypothetical protein